MSEMRVESHDVDNLVRALRVHADAKALRKELYSGLNRVTKRTRGEMLEVIPAALPRRGGLAEQMAAGTRARTSAKSGRWAGVSIRFTNKSLDLRTLTGKRLRHPVFGNRGVWVEQTEGVDPAVFMGEWEQQSPAVRREIEAVLEGVARKIAGDI